MPVWEVGVFSPINVLFMEVAPFSDSFIMVLLISLLQLLSRDMELCLMGKFVAVELLLEVVELVCELLSLMDFERAFLSLAYTG